MAIPTRPGARVSPGRCWACGSDAVVPDRRFARTGLFACRRCGLTFSAGTSPTDVGALYDDAYFEAYAGEGYAADAAQRRHEAALRIQWLRRWLPAPARLLEVGSAGGYLLEAAREAGYDGVGVEANARQAERARRELGVDVRAGLLGDVDVGREAFDGACAFHVLEHIPEPVTALEQIAAALRPGGHLFLEVPNAGSAVARLRRRRWPLLGLPGHVSQLTPSSLAALVTRAGFAPVVRDTVATYWYSRQPRAATARARAGELATRVVTRGSPYRPHAARHELLRLVAVKR
jgi:2-polyprenyl-3-methyl-5-hydroxy-6-metoxy-1,4-benzoquinol methylase